MGDDGHFRGTCGGALDPRSTRMGVLRGHAEGVCLKKRTDQIEKTIILMLKVVSLNLSVSYNLT